MITPTTFAAVLDGLLRGDAGRPLITFYDHASGERTELSVTTYANWVAKTAGLLADELDLERGEVVRLDLPTHWLGPVFLGAAWTVGLAVTDGDDADAYVCGPDGVARWAARSVQRDAVVLASALRPLGTRFADPLPPGVHDYGVEVWSQPDAWVAVDPPGPEDLAVGDTTHARLWSAAAAGDVLADGGRVLTEENPASPSGLSSFTEPLVRGGSLVLVAHADPGRLDATYAAERATTRYPRG
ncbi:MAG TPA: TIGR03089 family protein [Nocardioides sp.]|nr:TIGR03089 family protein [Nocardioides sp.]